MTDELTFRPAVPGDAATITRIRVRSWRAAYGGLVPQDVLDALDPRADVSAWAQWIAAQRWPTAGVLLAEAAEGVVGFAGFGPEAGAALGAEAGAGAGPAMIHTCYLLPDVWRRGYGTRMVAAVLRTLGEAGYREACLWVLEANDRGRRFYEATGWHADGGLGEEPAGATTLRTVRYRRTLTTSR